MLKYSIYAFVSHSRRMYMSTISSYIINPWIDFLHYKNISFGVRSGGGLGTREPPLRSTLSNIEIRVLYDGYIGLRELRSTCTDHSVT